VPLICPTCQNVFAGCSKHPCQRPPCYFAWGCFRYFSWEREPRRRLRLRGRATRSPFVEIVSASSSPSSLSLRSSYAGHHASPFRPRVAAPRVARRAKRGGPGRTRTCNQTVMSGGITIGFVDLAVFLFQSDRVHCASVGSFLVRNWCGHACLSKRAGINIRRSPSPNSLHDDHQADRLGPLKAETGVRFP
jgi:hypothetical protein